MPPPQPQPQPQPLPQIPPQPPPPPPLSPPAPPPKTLSHPLATSSASMPPVTASPANEPRCSTRLPSKSADEDSDPDPDPDAELERGAPRGKRQRQSAGKTGRTRRWGDGGGGAPVNNAPADFSAAQGAYFGYHFGAPGSLCHGEPLLADQARAAGYAEPPPQHRSTLGADFGLDGHGGFPRTLDASMGGFPGTLDASMGGFVYNRAGNDGAIGWGQGLVHPDHGHAEPFMQIMLPGQSATGDHHCGCAVVTGPIALDPRGRSRKLQLEYDILVNVNGDTNGTFSQMEVFRREDSQNFDGKKNIPFLKRTKDIWFHHQITSISLELESPRMLRYENMVGVKGYIYFMAKDQNGCRFLQQKFEKGKHHVDVIFEGIIDHIAEFMTNSFSNYLIQNLLDVCDEDQRLRIIIVLTEDPVNLLRISLNTHGTRAIQKLIETVKTRKQRSLLVLALQPGFVHLVNDLNGNHVIQKCLSNFDSEESKVCYARILDLKHKFLEAALRYYGICQIGDEDIDENALEHALSAAIRCTILAGAGPKCSCVLATLDKVEKIASPMSSRMERSADQSISATTSVQEDHSKKTQLFIKVCGHRSISVQENVSEFTVGRLVEIALHKGGFSLSDFYSEIPGKLLEHEEVLSVYNLQKDSTITVTPRLRGGTRFQLINMRTWNEVIASINIPYELVTLPPGLIDTITNISESYFLAPALQHFSSEAVGSLAKKHFNGICYEGKFTGDQILFENGQARFANDIPWVHYNDISAILDHQQMFHILSTAFWCGDAIQYPLHVEELLDFLLNAPADCRLNSEGVIAYLTNHMSFLPHMERLSKSKNLRSLIDGLSLADYISLSMISDPCQFGDWPDMIFDVPQMNSVYMHLANITPTGVQTPKYNFRASECVRYSDNYFKHANHVQFSMKQLEAALSLVTNDVNFWPGLMRALALRIDAPAQHNTPGVQRFLDSVLELIGNRTTLGV